MQGTCVRTTFRFGIGWRAGRTGQVLALLAALGLPGQVGAQSLDAPLTNVVFREGDTLRTVVGAELADPDLWPVVLQLSGLASVKDLSPGTVLAMPVAQVKATNAAILRALDAIQAANAEGARLFAPDDIEAALDNHATAVVRRGEGAWGASVQFADLATAEATDALLLSLEQRDRAAEALVTDVQGDVEGRSPDASRWTPRVVNAVLVQSERVRTLSGSTTQVTFRDLSRLRLNPNSNATIQRMRSDPLTGGEVTKIELVSGDFYALLNQLGERTSFQIAVAGLETTTESADFWIKTGADGARFANYDQAALVVGSGDQAVSLGANEGAVVKANGEAEVTEVLDRPALLAPADLEQVFGRSAALSWSAKQDAAGYWLEVASDAGFNQMQVSEWGIPATGFEVSGLDQGTFHWRVAALDAFGLPGAWSLARTFQLVNDSTPPYLTVLSPTEGTLISAPRVTLTGESETAAVLTLNGSPLPLSLDNTFSVEVTAAPGINTFALTAVDAAGNVTERTLTVTYRPAETLTLTPDPTLPRDGEGRFLTATEQLAFTATSAATPGSALRLTDATGAVVVQASVGDGGAISLTIPASATPAAFRLEVLSPQGTPEAALDLTVVTDAIQPEITFATPPPQAVARNRLSIAANVGDAVEASLNGAVQPLTDGALALDLPLSPGANAFELTAADAVGNVALRTFTVILDAEPPSLLRAGVARPEGTNGPLQITAQARDNSGLRAAARYKITVGETEQTGVLRCDTQTGECAATLPPQPGALRLISVTVQDYAGNTTEGSGRGN